MMRGVRLPPEFTQGELPPITVTGTDVERLRALMLTRVGMAYRAEARRLSLELRRAAIVAAYEIPHDVATMNSKLAYEDASTGERRTATLVYPWRLREPWALNVLSPIGTALFGLRVDDTITWTFDDGSTKSLRLRAVTYQPEAYGHWHL